MELLTIGHGTRTQDELLDALRGADVRSLVDVRIGPGSRRHPHVNRDALAQWLPAAGIGYHWERRLGGYRKLPADSPDTALRNGSFRAYAAHMRTPEFVAAVDELLAQLDERTAVMCSEILWWRCHRRLIADHVTLLRAVTVQHVMPDGRLAAHVPLAEARAVDGALVYDATPGRMG